MPVSRPLSRTSGPRNAAFSCDDLTARFFDNAVQSAEMLHAQLIDVYNAEADSHNSLVDAAENMQLDLGLKGKEIEELQLQIEHLKRQQQDAIDDATHDATSVLIMPNV
ncbi:putative morphogenetic protein [Escherichia coli]|uniref:Putative morphogenetic protein n=1 Tax=Escherichia coli TaxID=562 RepID=A0A376WQ06_ECOLX|nr:putative morphogenetic protein [Escherichia coli]